MRPKWINKAYITFALVAINCIVFVILEIMGDTQNSEFMASMGAVWPPYILEQGQYWRLLTATFMHFGFDHILNNMLILICAGMILEDALGHLQMLHSGDYAVAAGASGAIFGIIGALLWIVIVHKGRYETLTGKGLLFMIVISLYYGIHSGGVDNWGHVGGLIMGFLMGILLYRKKPKYIDFEDENPYTN